MALAPQSHLLHRESTPGSLQHLAGLLGSSLPWTKGSSEGVYGGTARPQGPWQPGLLWVSQQLSQACHPQHPEPCPW